MPGYQLIESTQMRPLKPRGIAPAQQTIGVLDFLREVEQDPFPLTKFSAWCVVGLEEVLYAARPTDRDTAIEIHRRLNAGASDLEKRLIEVQIVFVTGKIVRGADMELEYRGSKLPLSVIFNHPKQQTDANGNIFYPMEFHLSSP